MRRIYSRLHKEKKNSRVSGNIQESEENIFENGWCVARNSTSIERGIATARPYQSSFSVTVRHLSVSLAQLAGPVSCGTKQHRFEPGLCPYPPKHAPFERRAKVVSPSNGPRREKYHYAAVMSIWYPKGWLTHSVSIQKGLFLIPTAVWIRSVCILARGSRAPADRNQTHRIELYLLC